MGNQPSQPPQQHPSSSIAASGVEVRSATTTLNRRGSNTGATAITNSCVSHNTTMTTSSSTASSSPSISHQNNSNNNSNTRGQMSQNTGHNSGGNIMNLNIRNVFQQLSIKHGQNNCNNALGIAKSELDERCKPSGLYSTCHWDDKTVRRLIGDGKLASRQQWDSEKYGIDLDAEHHECPICFFTYQQINATKCCQANICTECYLQLQPYQKPNGHSNQNKPIVMNAKTQQSACPFCNTAKLMVTVGPMKQVQTQQHQPEQPMPLLSSPSKGVNIDQPESSPHSSQAVNASPSSGFGSSLEQNSRVAMMRARSHSIASEQSHSSSTTTSVKEQQEMVSQVAMTIQERQQIEEEMRAQHLHPLALKIEQEEMERRLKNQLQYYSQQQQQRNVQQTAAGQAVSSSGQHQSIPRRNQVYPTPPPLPQQQRHSPMLPPSISNILFLQHPSRAAPQSSSHVVRGLSEEQQIALAIEASLRDSTSTS